MHSKKRSVTRQDYAELANNPALDEALEAMRESLYTQFCNMPEDASEAELRRIINMRRLLTRFKAIIVNRGRED